MGTNILSNDQSDNHTHLAALNRLGTRKKSECSKVETTDFEWAKMLQHEAFPTAAHAARGK